MAQDIQKWTSQDTPNTQNGKWVSDLGIYGTLRQVLIAPKTPDTVYDVGLKDESGMVVFARFDVKGFLATEDLRVILFPGIKQLIIENSTKDEEFAVKLIYQS